MAKKTPPSQIESFKELEQVVESMTPGNEIQAYDFLESAACIIIEEPIRAVVVEAIRARRKWRAIKNEFWEMRGRDLSAKKAIEDLSKKHFYTRRTIEAIVYER